MTSLKTIFFLVLSVLLVISYQTSGQKELTPASRKAQKAYREAEKHFIAQNYEAALPCALRAVELDDRFPEAYLLLGDLYQEMGESLKSIGSYKKASEIDPDFYPAARLLAGKLELKAGLYAEAKHDLLLYLDRGGLLQDDLSQVAALLERCDFALNSIAHPVPFSPENLGPH
ncbi:MAG TPA: hypothetical protein P5184_03750, partial [Bacteroidales bacterium]|nr:hypothetical protein [Bacteroidales bacterium]